MCANAPRALFQSFDMAPTDFFRRQEAPVAFPGIPTDPAYYSWSVQGQLTAIDLSLMIIAAVLVVARVYIRVFVLGVFRLDDYFMVAAMVCNRFWVWNCWTVLTQSRFAVSSLVASFFMLFISAWENTFSHYRQKISRRCSCGYSSYRCSFR